jgi:inhibitor of cysteine peptidase
MKSKNLAIIIGVIIVAAVVILLLLSASKKNDYTYEGGDNVRPITSYDADDLVIQPALVDEISIQMMESFPVQVAVTAKGDLRNGCEEIYDVLASRNEDTFTVTLNAAAPKDATCTQVLRPFEETFALDVNGLPAGVYTVDVNGVTGTFELAVDNMLDFESSQDK